MVCDHEMLKENHIKKNTSVPSPPEIRAPRSGSRDHRAVSLGPWRPDQGSGFRQDFDKSV